MECPRRGPGRDASSHPAGGRFPFRSPLLVSLRAQGDFDSVKSLRRSFGALLLSIFAITLISSRAGASVRSTLSTISNVHVSPAVGAVDISWNLEDQTDVTYRVFSEPAGLTCTVVDTSSCSIVDTSSIPYSFYVVASTVGMHKSSNSLPSAPLKPRVVLLVAGQSNANGANSYVTDPYTGIDYFGEPYTNGADDNDLITWQPWEVLQGNGAVPVNLDSPQQVPDGFADGADETVFGPEIGLARQLWSDIDLPVTIIKAAYPGSDLAVDWSPTGTGTAPNGLFPAMVSQVNN